MAAKVTGKFPPLQRGLKGHSISKGEVASSREHNMDLPKGKSQRLAALFLLGNLLFNYPLLALFNRAGLVFGIPVLYAYVFAAWILLIALLVLVVEKR